MSQIFEYGKKLLSGPKPIEEKRVATMGMVGSGKTTVLGLLESTCVDLTQPNNPKGRDFFFLVKERTSGIRQTASDLRSGMFPEPTPMGAVFEADFLMRWEGSLSRQLIRIPFAETAGEEIQRLITKFQEGQYDLSPKDFLHADLIYDYILRSNGFIIIAPTTRIELAEGQRLEEETARVKDPDVNIARLLEVIYNYKTEMQAPPIQGIAVLLTKADATMKLLADKGMNLADPVGIQNFMSTYFKETYAVLKWYGLNKVKFWTTWVEFARDKQGNLIPYTRTNSNGSTSQGYKIAIHPNRRIPKYSQDSYLELINWVKTTFA